MKNVAIIALVVICGLSILYAFQQKSKVDQLKEEIVAYQKAAEASSAEAFILQQKADEHKAEAEEHKKIADEALEQVEKMKK